MEPRYRFRLYLLTTLILIGFGTLLTRLHNFQIERRDEFQQQVPGNRTETVREPGIRGEITDRNGIPLATNLRNYEVTFNLDEIYKAYRQQHLEAPTQTRLTTEGGLPRERTEKDIVTIVNTWTIEKLKTLGLAKNYNAEAMRTHYRTHGGLVPYSYRSDLTYEEFARFAEHNLDLPGVSISISPERNYPYGALASHVVGYLKKWEKGDIPESAARKFDHYIGEPKGIAGVEATMDGLLRGPEGQKIMLKDEKGRIIRMIDYTKPDSGAAIELTIDAKVQFLLENTLRRAGRAAGVIMDVNTGEVLAMASVPDFDPNAFIPSISPDRWKGYNENLQLAPFTNRAISSFTPGSTFKVPTAIAGAIQGQANTRFTCEGYVAYGNHRVQCWLFRQYHGTHGNLSLPEAIRSSCNPYFNKLANTIGWRSMVDGFQLVGMGKPTGIELPREDPGILPGSRNWRSSSPGKVMTPAKTAMLSIGQDEAMATPLQLATMISAVANGGKYYQPRLIKQAIAANGEILIGDHPKLGVDLTQSGVKAEDLALIRKGMWMAVNEQGGTASRAKLPELPEIQVAAKTGTAQTTDNGKYSNNSWILSFAPYDQPKYAICILVQNAGSGGAVCGPLVHLIYRGLFARDQGMELPLQPQTEFTGHLDRIEEITLPEDILAAINATDPPAAPADGETGEEAAEVPKEPTTPPAIPNPPVIPTPTITPEVDDDGTVIPRAVIAPEP